MKNILVLSFFLSVIVVLSSCQDQTKPNILPLTKSWEKVVPNQKVPKGLSSLSAKECGACHEKHYKEWQMSTHAHAWTDLQFQAELKKESSPFMCINCHIPLQNQQDSIVLGLIDGDIYQPVKKVNPQFDKSLQQEGINCASCHVRNNVIVGPTGTKKAPHETVKNPDFLSESLCISCHNATAVITPTLACTFETADEWKAGPYAEKQNCISCHMPEVQREVVRGFGERKSHYHTFAGSGIPKFDSVTTNTLNGLAFYPSVVQSSYPIGDSIRYSFEIKNEFAGHKVPTGDPERFVLVQFHLKDAKNNLITADTNYIGEHWEWYPKAKKLSDNNLLPKEIRAYEFAALVQEAGKYMLTVIVTKHRMNDKTAEYNKLGDNYPLFITIYQEDFMFVVE
jgi:hypothetical protein